MAGENWTIKEDNIIKNNSELPEGWLDTYKEAWNLIKAQIQARPKLFLNKLMKISLLCQVVNLY